ncbi:hypothetical protein Poly30_36870 [Planctomycetes bacterium Poly30]|uniref:Uncharacterized protein n=1 Tax=Saltatorellus ferox TaxID=2528018 RepID=A0A518EVN4_9BACT|nr:hypothetical protein Poly30_36870 [Planctomycetes bacterium Poly30]
MSSQPTTPANLELTLRDLSERLGVQLGRVVDAAGGADLGPQRLAEAIGVDKVLASRVLKALRREDSIARLHHLPGPDPLRRFVRASRRRLELEDSLAQPALDVIEEFRSLLATEWGDRSALTSLLAAWSPEVREEFELRRKQAAWRAMSELLGSTADLDLSAVILKPATDPTRLDVTWVLGLLGLRRLRPGVPVKATTRRIVPENVARRPMGLNGKPLAGLAGGRMGGELDGFCQARPGHFVARRTGDLLQYTLSSDDYGPESAVDVLLAEVNQGEMPAAVKRGSGRRGWVYADAPIPSRKLILDVMVHRNVYPGSVPELMLYDTSVHGVADVNDRTRDVDRLDLVQAIRSLGPADGDLSIREFTPYPAMMAHVFEGLNQDAADFQVHRVEIDYPLHGMQVAVAFDADVH